MNRRSAITLAAAGAATAVARPSAAADPPADRTRPALAVLDLRPGAYHRLKLALPAATGHPFKAYRASGRDGLHVVRLPDGKDVKAAEQVKADDSGPNLVYPVAPGVRLLWTTTPGELLVAVDGTATPGTVVEFEVRYFPFGLNEYATAYRVEVGKPQTGLPDGAVVLLAPGEAREVMFWHPGGSRSRGLLLTGKRELADEDVRETGEKPTKRERLAKFVDGGVTFTAVASGTSAGNAGRMGDDPAVKALLAGAPGPKDGQYIDWVVVRASAAADAKPGVARVYIHDHPVTGNLTALRHELRVVVTAK